MYRTYVIATNGLASGTSSVQGNRVNHITLLDGMDVAEYLLNPVVGLAHLDRVTDGSLVVIGECVELRRDGDRLIATAHFPAWTPVSIRRRILGGELDCASASVQTVKKQIVNGVSVITESILKNWVICEVGGNPDCVRIK